MLRLTPSEHAGKLLDAGSFAVSFAGSESNVASSLAVLGNHVQFITRLPDNQLGDAAVKSLNSFGINTQFINRGGSRLGIYFIELGASVRPSVVVYDRAGSAFSEINKSEFDWKKILTGKSWIFISGITPALSKQCAEEAIAFVKTAKQLGVKVCFDFNFRRSLWKDVRSAQTVFTKILEHTDLLCGNAGSLTDVYGIFCKGETEEDKTYNAIQSAQKEFGVDMIAFTSREHISASANKLSAVLQVGNKQYPAANYSVDIYDRFGTGDAFAAALLHTLHKQWDYDKAIQFATAAFALKHTIKGDQHTSSESEIISIMEGNTAGHVLR